MSATLTPNQSKKQRIEVRQYLPHQSPYGNDNVGPITGDYGKYEVVETIMRKLKFEQIGNFNPAFCNYDGNKRVLVYSTSGDISDPFRATEEYLDGLFISKPREFNVGDRVKLARPTAHTTAMHNGIVVKYHGEHNPKKPRVRWASGFGTTCEGAALKLLTPQEIETWPIPQRVPTDF